jgi:hypothetical protein
VNDLGTLVGELDLEHLRPGIHRLRLQIAEDGAGYPIALPMLIGRGKKEGPTLGVVASVHGNEVNGIPVIHKLFDRLEPSRLSGTVVAILVVNYPAFDRQQRQFLDGVDLNHIFPGRPDGSVSQIYAHRLINRAIRRFDYMIDLHTASLGRVNSLYARADLSNATTARLAQLLRPQIILHKRPRDGTLRGEADEMGIPAVTVEIGNPSRFQPEYIRTAVRGLRSVMGFLEMLKARPPAEGREPIICSRSHWVYTDRGGLLTVHPSLTDRLEEGDPLATLRNIYGDITAEYAMPEAGVIIGKQVNPVGYTGARIAHVGIAGKVESRA